MKQIIGFFVLLGIIFPGCAKKSSSKKVSKNDKESYIVIKDHRAPGVHKKAQRGLSESKEHAHKKLRHIKKAREAYYKKHAPRRVKMNKQK